MYPPVSYRYTYVPMQQKGVQSYTLFIDIRGKRNEEVWVEGWEAVISRASECRLSSKGRSWNRTVDMVGWSHLHGLGYGITGTRSHYSQLESKQSTRKCSAQYFPLFTQCGHIQEKGRNEGPFWCGLRLGKKRSISTHGCWQTQYWTVNVGRGGPQRTVFSLSLRRGLSITQTRLDIFTANRRGIPHH